MPIRSNIAERPTVGLQSVVLAWPQSFDTLTPARLLPPEVARRLIDFVSYERGLEQRGNFINLGSAALDNVVLRISAFDREDLNRFLLAHTRTKFYELVGSVWTDRTRLSGAYTGQDTQPWDSCVVLNKYVFTNYVDKIQVWDGTAANATDLAAAAVGQSLEHVRARFCMSFGGRLVLASLKEEAPSVTRALRLRWSKELAFEAPADWTDLGSGAVDLAETPDEITGIAKLGNLAVVYKSRSLYHMLETGDVNAPFAFELRGAGGLDRGVGLVSHFTIASLPGYHIALMSDNLYIYDGSRFQPIGDAFVNDVIRRSTPAQLAKSFATVYPSEHLYILWIPTAGETWPQWAGAYDYRRDRWIGEWNRQASCAGAFVAVTGTTIDQLVGTIDSLQGTIDSLSGETGSAVPAIGDPLDNRVKTYDVNSSVLFSAAWITGQLTFGFQGRLIGLSRIRFRVVNLGGVSGYVQAAASIDGGVTYLFGAGVAVAVGEQEQDVFVDLVIAGKAITLLVNSLLTKIRIIEWEPFFTVRGRAL